MIWDVHPGYGFISHPGSGFISHPGSCIQRYKKAPDPGSESATLNKSILTSRKQGKAYNKSRYEEKPDNSMLRVKIKKSSIKNKKCAARNPPTDGNQISKMNK
jgi:hypothetical protein